MGTYLNPNSRGFEISRNTKPYVDKSMMIEKLNSVIDTEKRYICSSRPRRFGKTMATNMIAAYYEKGLDAEALFNGLKIRNCPDFYEFSNKYDVIKINLQDFLSRTKSMQELTSLLKKRTINELVSEYGNISFADESDLSECLEDISNSTGNTFIIIIDEWDCIFREYPKNSEDQRLYLDFLRDLLKDKTYISLAYMTGILPIKKYGTQSALNMFEEFSMENPRELAEFTGFTEEEVENLCKEYNVDMEKCREWYDGYSFLKCKHIYNPKSIDTAVTSGIFDDYWNKTETYETLKIYIEMNFDGLKDKILAMMAGDHQKINTGSFQNDMTSLNSADDVLTLLIHLGYLGYDFEKKEVFIPNKEIFGEFVTATTTNNGWNEVINSILESEDLLNATWSKDEKKVAELIEKAHLETSHLQYNDENALSYTISLAYYSARKYYSIFREMPAGNGFADMIFLPNKNVEDKPAMVVELKWDKSANTAISQIHKKKYPDRLKAFNKNILLVGINYDKKTRKHECLIEEIK